MAKHFEHTETDYRLLAVAAARLRSDGLNQRQIATRLRKSQPEVSRMLAYAEEHRFLACSPSFLSQNINPAELKEVERRFFVDSQLRKALGRLARPGLHLNVQVLPDGDDEFACAAAGCVSRLLRRARLVGVMWGRTIRRVVSRICERRESFAEGGGCAAQCIPLCGDPVHLMNLGLVKNSASHLAADLGQAINPSQASDQPCLVGVPAYLSRRLFLRRDEASAGWENFVREIPGYRAIFGPANDHEKPWVERLDTIVSGMGIIAAGSATGKPPLQAQPTAAHEETGDFIRERLVQEEKIVEGDLGHLIFGDIGGWLIVRPGLEAANRRLVESLNQGWTGVKGAHFANVARTASPDGIPGVILVVAGAAKAEMVKELVRLGFVNELLINSSLAAALQDDKASG